MSWVRNMALTVLVLSLLIAGVAALPFLFLIGIVGIMASIGWLIYACIHDSHLEQEEEETTDE